MARIASRLKSKTSREKLTPRQKPYDFTTISPGIALGYRCNGNGVGTWVVRVADGNGGNWTKRVAHADDREAADGAHVLSWEQAIDKARELARGNAEVGRPLTVAEAAAAYKLDLIARGASHHNAGRITKHVKGALLTRPVGLLTSRELSDWKDGMLAGGLKPVTLVRVCKSLKAALNFVARRDHRITNQKAWTDGLGGLSTKYNSRNAQTLKDDQVRKVVDAAYAIDKAFGLYVHVAAETGARLSQIARLTVGHLQAKGDAPRLMMPTSRKGKGKKAPTYAVPITRTLADRLASNRPVDARLLLRADGRAWQSTDKGDHERLYARTANRAGVTGTVYALRHSSIVRALLANVPVRVVAASHDTSVAMIEETYSAFITDHADALVRRGLLEMPAVQLPAAA
jgi:integrase